ncbi:MULTISPECIES: HhH-GPD-type base excision DNA repair protein [Brevibacterium]|uniref:HhH-GPD-type base excision DNA repair protein n=1 Tax=Brevibacterium salitolerans TaxID=1403566 RepID=A0ABN2WAD5_9MICO|nr:HhH-GPD-type base excision DNA repair protein [Brevibacterium sp.]
MTLYLSTDAEADALLAHDRFALMVGMLLDQQVSMESAFAGPYKLVQRLGDVTPASIAAMDPDAFLEAFRQSPAVHRFPGSMAARVQKLAQTLVDEYGGDAEAVWTAPDTDGSAPSGALILRRLKKLPGFGDQKAKIFLALLGKQFGLEAEGWREAAGEYGPDDAYLSIADVRDDATLQQVRANKQARKAAAKAAKAKK